MALQRPSPSQRRLLAHFPTLLALAVLGVNLFVITVVVFTLRSSRRQYQLQAETTARNLGQVLEENLVGNINQINLALLAVKGEAERKIAAGQFQRTTLNPFITRQCRFVPAINNLRITDAQGEIVYGNDWPLEFQIGLGDRDYFRQLRDNPHEELAISEPLIGRHSGKWMITLARRVNRPDRSFAGIAYATVTLEHLTKALGLVDVGKKGAIALRGKGFSLLARYPISAEDEAHLGSKKVSTEFQEAFNLDQREGTYTTVATVDGVRRAYAFRQVSGYPFIIMVGLAEEDYFAGWWHQATWMWALVAWFFVITLLAWTVIYHAWKRQLAAHEAEQESERFLRTVIDLVPHHIFVKDRESRYLLVNRACAEVYGLTPEQMVGRRALEIIADPQQAAAFTASDREAMDSGTTKFIAGEELRDAFGRTHYRQTIKMPFVAARTGTPALIGVAVDITDYKCAQQALAESEARLRAIVELAPDAILVMSEQGRILEVNEAACKQLGYTRDQLLQLKLFHIVAPQFAQRAAARLRGEVPSGTYESAHIRADGVEIPIELSVTRIAFHGEPAFLQISRDIAERKRAEQQLTATANRLRAILDHAPVGIVTANLDDRFEETNPAFQRMTGYSAEELKQMHWKQLTHPDDVPANINLVRALKVGELQNYDFEKRYRLKNGATIWVRVIGSRLDEKHKISIVEDITERKQTAVATARLAAIVENSDDAIWSHTPEGTVVTWNESATRMFGYTASEMIGKETGLLVPEDRKHELRANMERVRRGERVQQMETVRRRKDGSSVEVSLSVSPILQDGKIIGSAVIARGISGRKQMEEQLRQAQKLEAVGQLAGGIAHDFNNLLMIVSGYAQMLQNCGDTNKARDYVQQILQAADRGASLTQQLLAFGRKQMLSPSVVDLNGVIAQTTAMLKRLIGENIELVFRPGTPLSAIEVDSGQITQVLLNLCINARDAMPQGGKITLETKDVEVNKQTATATHSSFAAGSYVLLTVSDTGAGMTKEIQERVFEPFFTTKKLGQGTGLGLSTVYGIVKQSEGYIWVDSELGHGSRFSLYFPRSEKQPLAEETGSAGKMGSGQTILLVEDEEALRNIVCEHLKNLGYRVLEAGTGEEALATVQAYQDSVDVVLADVIMPKMSGPEITSRLKQSPKYRDTKVLFMSGHTDREIVTHGILQSGVSFIQKPFSLTTLDEKLHSMLHPSH
jgi:PAS domain S-box-containing protein